MIGLFDWCQWRYHCLGKERTILPGEEGGVYMHDSAFTAMKYFRVRWKVGKSWGAFPCPL